ncbi:MAG: sulfatase-like hydrolase/transferase [Acidobacteriota bacterium]
MDETRIAPRPSPAVPLGRVRWAAFLVFGVLFVALAAQAQARRFPDIVLVTVDTLRFDRMSGNGYARPTSPYVDALTRRGAQFTQARTVEPLTAPALASMLTSRHPQDHGATRNGLPMRAGLDSLARTLGKRGYRTAAFVGNWTLRDELTGLGEHFDVYNEVFSRKRWFGLMFGEATAEHLNSEALGWLGEHRKTSPTTPVFLWVHYVEPHAPYRFHRQFAGRLGLHRRTADASDRYDTEIAFVDEQVGYLLAEFQQGMNSDVPPLVIFTADHGESLGEHDYWGHGRHLYEATLHIPWAMSWQGRLAPQKVDGLASILDLAPTVLGLVGLRVPESFQGFDWSEILRSGGEAPEGRITYHQAHRGAVSNPGPQSRRRGLLEVGVVSADGKEILRIKGQHRRQRFDLGADPTELESLVDERSKPSAELAAWLETVRQGLAASDDLAAPVLDGEALERLRALGYID